jgi:hypothetical protein
MKVYGNFLVLFHNNTVNTTLKPPFWYFCNHWVALLLPTCARDALANILFLSNQTFDALALQLLLFVVPHNFMLIEVYINFVTVIVFALEFQLVTNDVAKYVLWQSVLQLVLASSCYACHNNCFTQLGIWHIIEKVTFH